MNKNALIIGGVAIVGILGYMLYKKSQTSETTTSSDTGEQKSTDVVASTETSRSPIGLNKAIKGGTKTDISGKPVVSSKRGNRISSADFQKMEQAKKDIIDSTNSNEALKSEGKMERKKRMIKALQDFAAANNINYDAYADVIRRSANSGSSSAPSTSNETETFAFTLNF